MQLVSIITPAYRAEKTIVRTVESVLAQTYSHWEMLIIADDEADYEAILTDANIHDRRIRFLSTDGVATGEGHARNIGLRAARSTIIATLDADDTFLPDKLARCLPFIEQTPVVTCALELVSAKEIHLRNVGIGVAIGLIDAKRHKTANFSGESMIMFNRAVIDFYYDESLPGNADQDFLLRCFEKTPAFYHVAEPLQRYYKQPCSASNGAKSHIKFNEAKQIILQRIMDGYYRFIDTAYQAMFQRFYEVSLRAEKEYEALLKANPAALFEDVIEPMLQAL